MIYDTSNINALVLAGGINRIMLFQGYASGYKALLPFRGKPLIQYTLEALRKTPQVKRICMVGPAEEVKNAVADSGDYEYVNGGETLIENIHRGLNHFRDSPIVLVIPSDLPLATPQAISGFLNECKWAETAYEATIFWSMVPEEDFRGPYADVKKGFNRFRDFSVCHGNLLLITPSLLKKRRFASRIESIYNARKSSIRAALAVGPLAGLSYLLGVHLLPILTMSQFARIASVGFGVGLIPVTLHDPDIAVDIDEARDYHFITEELDRRGRHERS